jgi:hypothetical protein
LSLTIREEHRLGVFENRKLRNIFGSKRDEEEGHGENYVMESFICALHWGGGAVQVFGE